MKGELKKNERGLQERRNKEIELRAKKDEIRGSEDAVRVRDDEIWKRNARKNYPFYDIYY